MKRTGIEILIAVLIFGAVALAGDWTSLELARGVFMLTVACCALCCVGVWRQLVEMHKILDKMLSSANAGRDLQPRPKRFTPANFFRN